MSSVGNTGKSVLIKLIQYLLGIDNIISTDLLDMDPTASKGRFALGQLMGKRAILVGDQSMGVIRDSSVLKRLTGGDVTEMEGKNRPQQYHIWSGGIFVAGNKMPAIEDDKGKHIYERLLIVQLKHMVPEKERDPQMLDKLIKEADGIFSWAFCGLQRLIRNNFTLTYSSAIATAVSDCRADSDLQYKFLEEHYTLTFASEDRVPVVDFDEEFIIWYRQLYVPYGFPEPRKSEIRKKMASYGISISRVRIDEITTGVTVYIGIKKIEQTDNKKIIALDTFKSVKYVS